MKQQFEQLLKLAEETTNILREALAQIGKPAINMEHGWWYRVNSGRDWLIKFDLLIDERIMVLDSFCISTYSTYGAGYHWNINEIKSYTPATPEDMMLLPDGHPEKPKPALAATYEEVVDVVKPKWLCDAHGEINSWSSTDPFQLPTEQAANQHRAFIQIKNLEAYCAEKFEGERECTIDVDDAGNLVSYESVYGVIKVSESAAEWMIKTHPEPFLIFFGVKS